MGLLSEIRDVIAGCGTVPMLKLRLGLRLRRGLGIDPTRLMGWQRLRRVTQRRLHPPGRPWRGAAARFRWQSPTSPRRHRGMPSLAGLARRVAPAERVPTALFYTPLVLRWLWLGLCYRSLTLPTLTNPGIETGGFWGESKSDCLAQIGSDQQVWVARFVTLTTHSTPESRGTDLPHAEALMRMTGLQYPIVAKPDIGWQGYGVRLVDDAAELHAYLAAFPRGETLILQRYIPYDGEAGIFYVRRPGEAQGWIDALTLRYFPHIVGDGRSTVRELIQADARIRSRAGYFLGENPEHLGLTAEELASVPDSDTVERLAFIGSIRVGGLYRDGRALITPALEQRIDEIARSLPEFWYGRFDLRFDSIERLQAGEGFVIIEINGAGAEAIHAWDPETPLWQTYRELFRAQSLLFEIADRNRQRGFQPMSLRAFLAYQRRQRQLIARYPAAA